jgi:hypothetical protein
MFDTELQRVLDNIMDPNTTHAARTVTLQVKIKPDNNRGIGSVEIGVSAKLAAAVPVTSQFYLGVDRGKAVAYEYNPEQLRLGLEASNAPGIKGAVDGGKAVNA